MHRHSFFPARTGRPLVMALCLAAMVSGCALQPRAGADAGGVVAGNVTGTPLDPALGAFLAQAQVGAVQAVGASPWGSDVDITVEEAYLAASGRECRRLRIARAEGGASRELVCRSAHGWEARRLITEVAAGGARR